MFFSFFLVTSHKKDISLFWNDIHENNSFDRRINFFLDSWKAYFSSYYFIIVTEVSIFLLKCTSLLKCFWFISFRETPDSKLFYAQYEGRTKEKMWLMIWWETKKVYYTNITAKINALYWLQYVLNVTIHKYLATHYINLCISTRHIMHELL